MLLRIICLKLGESKKIILVFGVLQVYERLSAQITKQNDRVCRFVSVPLQPLSNQVHFEAKCEACLL